MRGFRSANPVRVCVISVSVSVCVCVSVSVRVCALACQKNMACLPVGDAATPRLGLAPGLTASPRLANAAGGGGAKRGDCALLRVGVLLF